MSKSIPEIMAPAGDFVCLSAALKAGADAVYFGLRGSNMRAGAKNFSLADLPKISKECAKFKAKAYLTLNTIYYADELALLRKQIKAAKNAGIDAVIAWDFAVLKIAKEEKMPVYLSTQASVANAESLLLYHKMFGINRFVLARECTLEQMVKIRKDLKRVLGSEKAKKIEIEVFVHGAMCVSQSGRCFMSTFACGKSANRGQCAQPCRREYKIIDTIESQNEFVIGNGYVMSPKDLCTLPFIEKLFEAGVDSLKIEGRGRNAEYVYLTVSAYKRVRDFYFANRRKTNYKEFFDIVKKEELQKLMLVFNRGFSEGFFMGKPLGDWTSVGNVSKEKKVIVGQVTNYFPRLGVAEISIESNPIKIGELIQFESDKTGLVRCELVSMQKDGQAIESSSKGERVAVKVNERVRIKDRVYKFK